ALHDSEQRYPLPKCYPGTRVTVQNMLHLWADDRVSLMWLRGPAGAGKSAIAQTMAERWLYQGRFGGSFFFAKWRTGGRSAERFFPTIAYQLALYVPGLRMHIGLAVESDPAISERALEEQARALIRRPLEMLETNERYLVVIDGLDECESNAKQRRILEILSEVVADGASPIKFLVCSRPEPHLHEAFESSQFRSPFAAIVLDNQFHPSLDILQYLRGDFGEIKRKCAPSMPMPDVWPSDEDLKTLIHKASGQFIYAATVLKF
ncbi:hypothetical protein K438DRAFT_1532582, partial [Mycena galopus ATCC 62051]